MQGKFIMDLAPDIYNHITRIYHLTSVCTYHKFGAENLFNGVGMGARPSNIWFKCSIHQVSKHDYGSIHL